MDTEAQENFDVVVAPEARENFDVVVVALEAREKFHAVVVAPAAREKLLVVVVAPEARVRRLSAAEVLVQAALVLASDDVFCCVRGYFVAFSYGYVMSVCSANV